MNNWQDYVGFQGEVTKGCDKILAFYLATTKTGENSFRTDILSHKLNEEDFIYDDKNIGHAVEDTIFSFPINNPNSVFELPVNKYKWKFGFGDYTEYLDDGVTKTNERSKYLPYVIRVNIFNRGMFFKTLSIKKQIARKTRRGLGNIQLGYCYGKYQKISMAIYYKGQYCVDSPIIVLELDGKYAIFKHPNFESYGEYLTNVFF